MSAEFSSKNICHHNKGARTYYLLSKRPGCYPVGSKKDRIFKWSPIHPLVIINFLEFTEFSGSLASFKNNSGVILSHYDMKSQ